MGSEDTHSSITRVCTYCFVKALFTSLPTKLDMRSANEIKRQDQIRPQTFQRSIFVIPGKDLGSIQYHAPTMD